MAAIVLDCETEEARKFFMGLTTAAFTDQRGFRWKDTEDPPGAEIPNNVDLEAAEKISAAFAFLKEE